MHYALHTAISRYHLTVGDIFQAVYPQQWEFRLKGMQLSFNCPEEVEYFCWCLLEKPST